MSRDARGRQAVTLATWVTLLHARGRPCPDATVAEHCQAIVDAADSEAREAQGTALVALLGDRLSDTAGPDGLRTLAASLYGDALRVDLAEGGPDDLRHRLRMRSFAGRLPFLAWIWERHGDGEVAPHWVLVERAIDTVELIDPDPFDALDEDRSLAVDEFLVLWRLGGHAHVAID